MILRDRRALKERAANVLSGTNFSKTVLIHAAILTAASVVMGLIQLGLDSWTENTGGLSGMGTRSVLATVSLILSLVFSLATVFWQEGLTATAIRAARGQYTQTWMLKEGFVRFKRILLYLFMLFGLFMGLMIACCYAAAFLTMFMPADPQLQTALEKISMEQLMADPYGVMLQLPQKPLMKVLLPVLIVALSGYAVIAVLLLYRLRFARYALMDGENTGPVDAFRASGRLTRGEKRNLFRLDLSFWWYYLLQVAVSVVAYLDLLLPAVGVALPFSQKAAYWIFYAVSLAAQLVLAWKVKPYILGVYATAYQLCLDEHQPPAPPQIVSQ